LLCFFFFLSYLDLLFSCPPARTLPRRQWVDGRRFLFNFFSSHSVDFFALYALGSPFSFFLGSLGLFSPLRKHVPPPQKRSLIPSETYFLKALPFFSFFFFLLFHSPSFLILIFFVFLPYAQSSFLVHFNNFFFFEFFLFSLYPPLNFFPPLFSLFWIYCVALTFTAYFSFPQTLTFLSYFVSFFPSPFFAPLTCSFSWIYTIFLPLSFHHSMLRPKHPSAMFVLMSLFH